MCQNGRFDLYFVNHSSYITVVVTVPKEIGGWTLHIVIDMSNHVIDDWCQHNGSSIGMHNHVEVKQTIKICNNFIV